MNKKINKNNKKILLLILVIFLISIILLNVLIKKIINNVKNIDYEMQETSNIIGAYTNNYNSTEVENGIADNFTVQFYAYINSIVTENTGDYVDLNVIETHTDTGAVLPTNNGSSSANYNLSTVELNKIDGTDDKYEIVYEKVLTQLYSDESYSYAYNMTVETIDKLKDNSSYSLKEIWILNENGDPESNDTSTDWKAIDYSDDIIFTNNKEHENDENTIYISSETTLRLVYETASEQEKAIDANFYDYNITDGNVYASDSLSSGTWTGGTQYYYTYKSGINSASNYTGSGTMLGFGNSNTGSGLASLTWTDANNVSNLPNKYNSKSYKGTTFGLVNYLDGNSNIVYSDGIITPNLFDEGEAIGKETFSNAKLNFIQDGDTYILTSVSSESNNIDISGLDTFIGRDQYAGGESFGSVIYSNDFWPLDDIEDYEGKDPLMGDYYNYQNSTKKYFGEKTSNLPLSDDSEDHNYYFGMHLSIEFTVTEDYVGPLEYLFYGDDDIFVFLDGKLISDIGGIHTSIGEHVDFWDYIDKGTEETYTLDIYYMERGGSGSTCYMSYTLPSVSSATTSSETGKLKIIKTVESDYISDDTEFDFKLSLANDGSALIDVYNYSIYNENGSLMGTGTIGNGGTFSLKNGEYIIVNNLPVGTKCEVEELSTKYLTSYKINGNEAVYGVCSENTIASEDEVFTIEYINETKTTEVTVTKTWIDSENLYLSRPSLVTMKLSASVNDENYELTGVETEVELTSAENWTYTWKNLLTYDTDGNTITYNVEEVSSIEGYYLTSTETKETEDGITVEITNSKYGSITVKKIDSKDDTKKLEGATFKLEKLADDGTTVDETFIAIEQTTSSDELTLGTTVFENLEYGKYRLTEIKAPEGYRLITTAIEVEIKADNTEQEVKISNVAQEELPETGGIGSITVIMVGILLIVTGFVIEKNLRKETNYEK